MDQNTIVATAAEPTPVVAPVEVSSTEYFENPGKATRAIVVDVIQSEMKEVVAELRQDMAVGRTRTAWDDAISATPAIANIRPMLEAIMTKRGVQNPNADTITSAYYLALGQATAQGTPLPGMTTTPVPTTVPAENTRAIPQHAASTQPLATPITETQLEPFTEAEARLARENNQTLAEFRGYQDLDIADVVRPPEPVK